MNHAPGHAKLSLGLALALPLYLVVAALGTRFGIWGWQFGLGTLVIAGTPILLGVTALLALVSLILIARKPPRTGWWMPAVALLIVIGVVGAGVGLQSRAGAIPPIHDVSTDTDPPSFSPALLQEREAAGANPIIAYDVPLGRFEPWQGERFASLADTTLADVMRESYGDLKPLPIGSLSTEQAADAVVAAMEDMGAEQVRRSGDKVEATFRTFWFGFRDDVVAQIADGQIDFRSVSRVGVSDLGKNAERIRELRAKTAEQFSS